VESSSGPKTERKISTVFTTNFIIKYHKAVQPPGLYKVLQTTHKTCHYEKRARKKQTNLPWPTMINSAFIKLFVCA